MVTAADGAEEHYNLGNKARSEGLQQAIAIDRKLQNCWVDHPQFFIADNSSKNFKDKLEKVFNQV